MLADTAMRTVATTWCALVFAALMPGCACAPSTTAAAPSAPYVAAQHEAVVVLHRRSIMGRSERGESLSIVEKWSHVRVHDEVGQPLADLRATEHAVVRVKPGAHRFYFRNWAAAARPACVAAMSATLEGGRVYAVHFEALGRDTCGEVIAVRPVLEGKMDPFFSELAETRSEQRAFLGENRERSMFLDGASVERAVVNAGELRLAEAGVALMPHDGVPWVAVHAARR